MKRLYEASTPAEAHTIVGLLENEGFKAVVQGEEAHTLRGGVPWMYPEVWIVEDADFEKAKKWLLEVYEKDKEAAAHDEPWECAACGEKVEGQFTECWNCLAEKGQTTTGDGASPDAMKSRTPDAAIEEMDPSEAKPENDEGQPSPEGSRPVPTTAEGVTAWYCGARGACNYGTYCGVLVTLFSALALFIGGMGGRAGTAWDDLVFVVLRVWWLISLPMVFLGIMRGYELHRYASRSKSPLDKKWIAWGFILLGVLVVTTGLFGVGLLWFLLPIFIFRHQGRVVLGPTDEPPNWLPFARSIFMIGFVMIVLVVATGWLTTWDQDDFVTLTSVLMFLTAGLGMWLADRALTDHVAHKVRHLGLAPLASGQLQFSLRALMAITLLMGGYLTGVVLLFRSS